MILQAAVHCDFVDFAARAWAFMAIKSQLWQFNLRVGAWILQAVHSPFASVDFVACIRGAGVLPPCIRHLQAGGLLPFAAACIRALIIRAACIVKIRVGKRAYFARRLL